MPEKIDETYHHPDDIVISGISGMFPASDNIEQFKRNLFDGIDMITTIPTRGRSGNLVRMGAIKTTNRFDNEFFHMDNVETENLPCSCKLLLERIVEAVMDAGYNLEQIKNKNIAVVCGHFDGFSQENNSAKLEENAPGPKQTHFLPANSVSRFFDITGPSTTIHSACSASLVVLDCAIKGIRNGDFDGALVGASNICRTPADMYYHLGVFSKSGISRPFDAAGDGYVRAEATVALFLQKRKDARRIYANLLHSKINGDGFKEQGVFFPSMKLQKQLLSSVYKETDIDPSNISYVEAHGTGTKVGDVVEGTSIEEFFCANRKTTLKIGTVKSNMGHSEGAAACCSLVKMILAFEEGLIPANLKFENPNPKIKGLFNGKLEVITKHIPVEGKYFAINSFGVGGTNGHVIISPHDKEKKRQGELTDDGLPRLVTVSGRTDDAVNSILENVEKNYRDHEYIRLIHEIFSENTDGYLYRGFKILNNNGNHVSSKNVFCNEKRPLWFIFSGMGSQWSSHGISLMKIPIFAESIYSSHKILESKGVDLLKIITSDDPQIIRNTLNSYVGIVAIQIALVDMLKTLGVKCDGFMGFSIGEMACAYMDECLTAEQTILAAYYFGLVTLEVESTNYSTAVVDKSYNEMKNQIPPEISILSHDGPNCCTISGPEDVMRKFIKELLNKNVSVKETEMTNIANNHRFINSSASKLTSYLTQIIKEPNQRSRKWLSTSALEHLWSTDELKYCSAQYFTNNFCSPVYFEETLGHIPSNAIVIEIAPYGYFRNISKCLSPKVENIPLTTIGSENGVEFFLTALGRMYEVGCALKLSNLYPPVEFPVSKSTPMISSLIKWQHNAEWNLKKPSEYKSNSSKIRIFTIDPASPSFKHVKEHVLDGRNLYPGFGYLELVWDMVTIMSTRKIQKIPIVFENIRFERATIVPKKGVIEFRISLHLGTNRFEITENGALVVSGKVRVPDKISQEEYNVKPFEDEISNSDILPLNTKDFYKEMRLRGYHYTEMFKKVVYANAEGTYGRVAWSKNFTTFMDTMAQIPALRDESRDLLIPTYLRKLVINLEKHYQILETLDKENPEFPVNCYPNLGLLCSGGVQMMGFGTNGITRQPDKADPVMEKQTFVPYICDEVTNMDLVIRLCVHIALENVPAIKVKTYEILTQEYPEEDASISDIITKTLGDIPMIQASVNVLSGSVDEDESELSKGVEVSNKELPKDNSATLIVLSDIGNKTELFEPIFKALKLNGFIITRESRGKKSSMAQLGFNICFSRPINADEEIFLLQKIKERNLNKKAIRVRNDSYSWISEAQNVLSNIQPDKNEEFVVYAEKEPTSGILGFFSCLRKEENGMTARCFNIADETAPDFSLDSTFYKSQLDKNLSHNVYKNGRWGSYRHLSFVPTEEVEVPRVFCNLEKRGDLSSFKWVEDSLDSTKTIAHVYFSSLNFRDVMLAVGRLSISSYHTLFNRLHECYIGGEYSGRDETGRRIMGMTSHKGIATIVETSGFTWTAPDHMSLEEAATIPVIYTTVIYALFFKTQLEKGSSILIHAGAGGIGQAAINICLHYGCNIFTTVGSSQKIEFIRKTYPQIPENHICNSRDTSFEKVIMEQTNGRGVDIVLNSLAQEILKASLRCVAKGGHFLEIGKFDMFRNNCVGKKVELMSSESSENSNEEPIPGISTEEPHSKRMKRARQQFITPELVATFDRCKVSARNAVMILTETVKALKLDPDEFVINKSSIQRCKEKLREVQFDRIRKMFENIECNAIVIHWDGKLLPNIDSSKKENIERLPVIASYLGKEQLLGVAEIESSSGLNQATAIFELLHEWDVVEKVQALCSDTTASNTGRLNGACVLLEQMLERELLYFPCRHHILEVMLRGVFDEKLENSSSPIVPIFKRFQSSWTEIEKNNFQSGMEDEFVRQVITEPESKELINFCVVELTIRQSREDYAELLFLIIMFLGGEEKMIRAPGAFHHARWMAKALYCLKIFLYRAQFDLEERERTGIRDMCLFIAKVYGKYWIQATSPIKAPRLDYELLRELKAYEEIDGNLSKAALNKIKNHLWYLSPENVALSFFDDGISLNVKKKMVLALDNIEEEELLFKRIPLPNNFENDMDQFVNSTTLNFFSRFGISTNFLKTDPETWESSNDYQIGKDITAQLRVVNDAAERGVKLITDYNTIITKNEEQKQFLLQVVAQHRKDFPDVKRETLKKGG